MNGVRPFLRAEWRHLAILNFVVEPSVLEPILPRGLELDRWEDRHYVSLIGFQFLHLRILGMPVPCHRSFDEVNLRFYVRRKAPDGWRHGAVFIKELVSRRAIAFGARTLFNEPCAALPMWHRFEDTATDGGQFQSLTYAWTCGGREQSLKLTTVCSSTTWSAPAGPLRPHSWDSSCATWQRFTASGSPRRWECPQRQHSSRKAPRSPCRGVSPWPPAAGANDKSPTENDAANRQTADRALALAPG